MPSSSCVRRSPEAFTPRRTFGLHRGPAALCGSYSTRKEQQIRSNHYPTAHLRLTSDGHRRFARLTMTTLAKTELVNHRCQWMVMLMLVKPVNHHHRCRQVVTPMLTKAMTPSHHRHYIPSVVLVTPLNPQRQRMLGEIEVARAETKLPDKPAYPHHRRKIPIPIPALTENHHCLQVLGWTLRRSGTPGLPVGLSVWIPPLSRCPAFWADMMGTRKRPQIIKGSIPLLPVVVSRRIPLLSGVRVCERGMAGCPVELREWKPMPEAQACQGGILVMR